ANITRFNNAFTETLGWKDDIIGKPFFEVILDKDIVNAKSKIKKVLDEKTSMIFELCIHSKDRSKEIPVLVTIDLLRDTNNIISGLVIAAKNISERVRHEKLLLEERDKAQKYLDIAGVIFVAINNKGEVILINRKGCEVLGYEENEIIGKNWHDHFIPERFRNEIKEVSKKVFAGKIETVENYENAVVTKSGEERIIVWHNSAIYDKSGNIESTLSSGEDITDKRLMANELKESEERFKSITGNINVGIYRRKFDESGKFITVNPAMAKIFGFKSPNDMTGSEVIDFYFHNKDKDNFKEKIENLGFVKNEKLTLKRKDGTTFIGSASAVVVYNNEGKTQYIDGVIEDITEKEKAAQALKESEEKFRSIFEMAPDSIFIVDKKGYLKSSNKSFLKISGYSENEIVGKHFTQLPFINMKDIPKFIGLFKSIVVGKIPKPFETSFSTKNGIQKHAENTVSLLKEQGKIVGIQVMARDITERKRTDQLEKVILTIANASNLAKDLNEMFSVIRTELGKVIDTSNLIIALYNKHNQTFSLPFMVDEKDHFPVFPAKKTLTEYIIKNDKPLLADEEFINQLEKQGIIELVGTPSKIWMGVPLKSKSEIIGAIIVQSYENENAYNKKDLEILKFVSNQIGQSIQRKNDEDQLRKLSTAIFHSSAAVLITDSHANIEFINPKFTEITGYTLEEVKGKNPSILKSGKQTIEFYQNLWNTVLNGKEWRGEFLNKKKNGELYWDSGSIAPVKNEEGITSHYIAIKEDITEKKNIEKELITAKEKAEESDRLKTAFLANISHEIRTPMNAITVLSDLIINTETTEEEKLDFIQTINNNINSLLDLIENIIRVAKLEAGETDITLSKLNILNFMDQLENQYFGVESQRESGQIEFIVKRNKNADIIVNTDFKRLEQIFGYLIENAIKYTESGKIEIGYDLPEKDKIHFYVKDTGIGISLDKLKIIFERFRQVDDSNTRKYGGTGISLTITKKLVELLNGKIWVNSEIGKGTTFHFTLPIN
ncbi:PAS domain S-box protein, partial [Bacteroidota bacterium]